MTKNYKILTSYIKNVSSQITDTESYIYLKENIPKYSLGIDINSLPLKNNMAEVNIKLSFNNKNSNINFCKKVITPNSNELKEHQNFLNKSLKKNYF